MTQAQPNIQTAKLVMDSRKTMLSVRNQNLSGSWSQLYKAGDIYLDLSLRTNASEAVLMGHLVADPSAPIPPKASASLRRTAMLEHQSPITPTGSFRLPITGTGVYRLELELQDQIITVDKLEI